MIDSPICGMEISSFLALPTSPDGYEDERR